MDDDLETDFGIEAIDLASLLFRFEEATSNVIDVKVCVQNESPKDSPIKISNSKPDLSIFPVRSKSSSKTSDRNAAKGQLCYTSILPKNGPYPTPGIVEPATCQTEHTDKAALLSFLSSETQFEHVQTEQTQSTVVERWNNHSAMLVVDSLSSAVLGPQELNSDNNILFMNELMLHNDEPHCDTFLDANLENSGSNASVEDLFEVPSPDCSILSNSDAFEMNSVPVSSHELAQLQCHQNLVPSITTSLFGDEYGMCVEDFINSHLSHDIEHISDIGNCIFEEGSTHHSMPNFDDIDILNEFDHNYCTNNLLAVSAGHHSEYLEEPDINLAVPTNIPLQSQSTALDIGEPSQSISDFSYDDSFVMSSQIIEEFILEDKEVFVDSDGNDLYSQDPSQPPETGKYSQVPSQPLETGKYSQVPSQPPETGKYSQVPSQPLETGKYSQVPSQPLETGKYSQLPSQPLEKGKYSQLPSQPLETGKCSQLPSQPLETGKCQYNQQVISKAVEKKDTRKRPHSSLQHHKHNTGSVHEDANVFYDKIPSYYTALSIPLKPVTTTVFESTTKAIGTTDHLDLSESSGPSNEGHYDKVPAHRRCFTNTTKDVDIKCENSKKKDITSNIVPKQNSLNNSTHEINGLSLPFQSVLSRVDDDDKHAGVLYSHYSKISGRRSRSTNRRSSSTSRFSRRSASSMSDCSTCSSCSNRSHCSTCSIFSRSSSSSGSESGSSRSRSPSPSRGNKYHTRRMQHHFTPSTVSRSRSRTVSPCEDSGWRSKQQHSYRNRHNSSMEVRSERRKIKEEEQARAMEERRIVYVGKIPDGYTKRQLYQRFQSFGEIKEVKLNFREHGDNYGFVTFTYACDAISAKEKGNSTPGDVKFDLCFGGRRHFCPDQYADLDGNREIEEEYAPMSRKLTEDLDYAALLKMHSTHQRKKIA